MCGCTECFNTLPKDRLPLRSLAAAYGVGSPTRQEQKKKKAGQAEAVAVPIAAAAAAIATMQAADL
jgi:hypothetical protein